VEILIWPKIFEVGNYPSPGLVGEFLELSLISYVTPIDEYLATEPRTESKITDLLTG
jgi:hypothetical protein